MNSEGDCDVAEQQRRRFRENAQMYSKSLRALVMRWTANPDLATEISQQAIFKYLVKREEDNWQTVIRSEKWYLVRIAHNLVKDGWRDGKTNISLDQELEDRSRLLDQLGCDLDLEKSVYLKELRQRIPLKTILRGFSEYQLLLLRLHTVDGLSYKEIGREVNQHHAVVKWELGRVMASIRARVRKIFGDQSFF